MRSSSANPYAPDRNHQTPIGCRHRLCLSPLLLQSTQGRAAGQEDGKPPFRGKAPQSQIRNRCVILVGENLFYSLASPFRFEKPALPLPRLITATQTNSRSPPSTLSRGGESFPGAKKYRRRRRRQRLHRQRQRQLLPHTRWQGGGADDGCNFFCGFSPRPLASLAPPSRQRRTCQLRFYPVPGACALEPPQPLVGVE